MKNYKCIQKNQLALFSCIILIIFSVSFCFASTFGFYNVFWRIVSYFILGFVLMILLLLILTGKISRIKVSSEGMYVRTNRKHLLYSWSDLIKIEIKKIMRFRGGPFLKATFYSKEKSFNIYSQDYFFDYLIEYCISDDFAEELKILEY